MSSKDDTGQIIKDFLDLWQKQFAYIAREPETVASMLQAFQNMQSEMFNNSNIKENAKPDSGSDIFRDANDELRKLKQRIASLEARVVELESSAGKAGKKNSGTNKNKNS